MGAKKYVKEVIKEGKRVRWPKWDVFFPALVTVIIICVFAALVLSLEDFVAGSIVNTIKGWFSSLRPADDTTSAAIRMFLLK